MTKLFILIAIAIFTQPISGQNDSIQALSKDLNEIEISAYSARSDLIRIPAALQILKDSLHLDQSFSFAGLLNQAPGVKIEERSPGSYRFSIRGSTLRSPFGVRNIKIYLDGFSLSDGGGNTYLQLLNPSQISKAEIIKGPASSMYGSGAGGALLLTPSARNEASLSFGSYQRRQESLNLAYKIKNWDLRFFQGHQSSKGYREQSALRRDMVFSSQKYINHKSTFQLFQLYGELDYETPGGLTVEQQAANPRQARPAAGRIPGAVEQNAGIRNKTLMGGIGYDYEFSPAWSIAAKGSAWYTDFQNPFITNYEVRNEMNYSFRPILKYFKSSAHGNIEWTNGYEYLTQTTLIKNFGNKKGTIDTLQLASNIAGNQSNLFTQIQWNIDRWQILSGISLNQQIFKFKDRSATQFIRKESGPVLMPRLSFSYNLSSASSVFVSMARGNSPPTLAEIRPSSGEYNQELLPEGGWNYELGYRNYGPKLDYTLNLYSLKLQDAIVRRNDLAGVEYFINSGGVIIHGIETNIRYRVKALDILFATAWQPYKFINYKQRTTDFSGLSMTGVPEHTITTQLSWNIVPTLHLGLNFYYQSDLPLNDANTAKLPSYSLLNGYALWDITHRIHFTLSGENLLNEQYSSGPDINAAANRYYNPGAQNSIMAGIRYTW